MSEPSSPELTEAEVLALRNASTGFMAESIGLSMSGYAKDAALHREWSETIDNLLARTQSPPDTVTLPREVVQTLVDCQCDPLDLSVFEEREQQANAIEAAEQALARTAKKEGE